MPGFIDELAPAPTQTPREYTILKQRVDLDIDFARRALKGSTEITLQPLVRDLKHVRLHCRQCRPTLVQAGGITARWNYDDPYRRLRMPVKSTVEQHAMLKSRIESSLSPLPQPELDIALPTKLKIQELQLDPATALPQYINTATPSLQKQESDAMAVLETPTAAAMLQSGPQFAPIRISIDFEVESFRDGLHWVGFEESDARYPYVYTKAELAPGNSSCIFPCVDDETTKCLWDLSIKTSRTLGDAFRKPKIAAAPSDDTTTASDSGNAVMVNGLEAAQKPDSTREHKEEDYLVHLSEEDAALELSVVSVGELVDDTTDSEDDSRHTLTFSLSSAVTARHIGFAIGPFEHIDLATFREADDEEKLGRSAVKIDAYCLPGRAEELRNTAYPIHLVIDFFGQNYGSFPFSDYQLLFIDDLAHDTVPTAGLTFCSSDLLFPFDILEPMNRNTKKLVRAVADQWMGVNVVAKDSSDAWVVAGIAGFMSDLFNKKLFGNNEYRWAQKQGADKVYELDVERPSLQQLGALLHIDPTIREFVDLKSALVLAILDRRLIKASSATGVTRIINKIFLNAKTGSLINGELSTIEFQRTCEKLGHNKLDLFFRQWVFGAGCPIFDVKQRFNKKKLVVEMTITQRQVERISKPEFEPSNFMREIKEFVGEVWAPEVQPVFTGPMTVRIHEADGTPYEHIIDIKEQVTRLDIPYNTKYKRLKRSRRQKERALASAGNENNGDGNEDALLYCLGDILDSPQEIEEWKLKDWTPEEETLMGQESYEWIRMDADFEWIGKIHLQLPLYMYVSQLQQDRDLVAQYESVKYIQSCGVHHTSLSVLVRTLMDRRYFHGIRTMAADAMAVIGKDKLQEVGQFQLEKAFSEMFCFEGSIMPRPNDWSSRVNFLLQCALPQSLAQIRDADGKVPLSVRRFFVDKLKFNDNSNNEFSDVHYLATLMRCLSHSLVVSHREPVASYSFDFGGDDEPMPDESDPDAEFEREAINEIERYRRIDEWISTYHNIYSITAIDCLRDLTKAGCVKDKTKELLSYTRRENADNVRLAAFECLTEIGTTKKMSMMAYLLHSLADGISPAFRERLLACFGVALGHIALGDSEQDAAPQFAAADADGLVIEQDITAEARQLAATRKTTPEGALAALKNLLHGERAFKDALWFTATSENFSLDQVAAMTDIAALMFEAKTSLMVTLKLPRTYHCVNLGKGKLKFVADGPYRTVPVAGLPLEDWEILQQHGLKYTGKLSDDVRRKQDREQRTEETLRVQIEEVKRQAAQQAQQAQQAAAAPPPPPPTLYTGTMPPPATPISATPTAEKSGFKLSLGGNKRKQSTSSTPREGSPKASKIKREQTPGSAALAGSPISRASPAPAPIKARRGSTSSVSTPSSVNGRKMMKKTKIISLKFSQKSAEKAAAILATAPSPVKRKSSPATAAAPRRPTLEQPFPSGSKSITPANGSAFLQSPLSASVPTGNKLVSPSGYNGTSPVQTQTQNWNAGAFRSFGPVDAVMSPGEVKREDSGSIGGFRAAAPAPAPVAVASPGVGGGGIGGEAMPPPKKKFTLKLGSRKASESS